MRDLERRSRAQLERYRTLGLRRSLNKPSGLDLCSNDYLGHARDPRIRNRLARAAERLGVGSTGSRLLRGHRQVFGNLEERFAALKGTPTALFFGSGWAANLGVLATFPVQGDVIFSDALNHASLIDGMRLSKARRVVFPHCDADALEEALRNEPCDGQRFVVTESLFSMDGDFAPLGRYADLQERHGFALIVDEAHAVGVYGATGSGLVEELDCADSVFVSTNAAGKALGVCGAFVCGPHWATELLIQSARSFVFSTALPPAIAEAVDESLDLVAAVAERRTHVRQLGRRVRDHLGLPPHDSPIVPVIIGANDATLSVAERLRRRGYDTRAIRPPTVPEGTSRLRVSLNATLEYDQLDRFARDLGGILKDEGLCLESS